MHTRRHTQTHAQSRMASLGNRKNCIRHWIRNLPDCQVPNNAINSNPKSSDRYKHLGTHTHTHTHQYNHHARDYPRGNCDISEWIEQFGLAINFVALVFIHRFNSLCLSCSAHWPVVVASQPQCIKQMEPNQKKIRTEFVLHLVRPPQNDFFTHLFFACLFVFAEWSTQNNQTHEQQQHCLHNELHTIGWLVTMADTCVLDGQRTCAYGQVSVSVFVCALTTYKWFTHTQNY